MPLACCGEVGRESNAPPPLVKEGKAAPQQPAFRLALALAFGLARSVQTGWRGRRICRLSCVNPDLPSIATTYGWHVPFSHRHCLTWPGLAVFFFFFSPCLKLELNQMPPADKESIRGPRQHQHTSTPARPLSLNNSPTQLSAEPHPPVANGLLQHVHLHLES